MYKSSRQIPWLFLSLCLFIAGCVTQALKPGAEKVYISAAPVSASCKSLGSVISTNVNGSTVPYTSEENLTRVGLTSLKNQAYNLGGNYVVLNRPQTTMSQRANFSLINTQTMSGRAYKCPANTYYGPEYQP